MLQEKIRRVRSRTMYIRRQIILAVTEATGTAMTFILIGVIKQYEDCAQASNKKTILEDSF